MSYKYAARIHRTAYMHHIHAPDVCIGWMHHLRAQLTCPTASIYTIYVQQLHSLSICTACIHRLHASPACAARMHRLQVLFECTTCVHSLHALLRLYVPSMHSACIHCLYVAHTLRNATLRNATLRNARFHYAYVALYGFITHTSRYAYIALRICCVTHRLRYA